MKLFFISILTLFLLACGSKQKDLKDCNYKKANSYIEKEKVFQCLKIEKGWSSYDAYEYGPTERDYFTENCKNYAIIKSKNKYDVFKNYELCINYNFK